MNSSLEQVNEDFESVIITAEKISQTVRNGYKTMKRTDYEEMLKELVSSRDSIFGAGVWLEPYMYDKDKKYFGPYVFRDNGKMTYSDIWESDSYDYFRKEWYTNVNKINDTVWTAPFIDEILNIAFVTASKKIVASDGSTIGVATADINISKIRADINYSLRLSENSTVFLVDRQGTFIALNKQDEMIKVSEVKKNRLLSDIVKDMTIIKNQTSYYNGNMEDNIVCIKKTDFPGWYMGIAVPREDVFSVIKTSFIIVSVAISFLAIVIIMIMRQSTRWVKKVLFENTGTAATIIDHNMKIALVNNDFMELTGYNKEELLEYRFSDLIITEDLEAMKNYFTSLKKTTLKNNEPRCEIQIESKDKEVKDILLSMGLITGTNYSIVSLIDITNCRTMEKKLEYFSFHDVLTGLHNRTYFEETLKNLESEESYAMIICDVDNQKLVNDTFGHAVGDQKLINVSNIISCELAPQDIAARIGGDEFAVIIKGARSVLAEKYVKECNN